MKSSPHLIWNKRRGNTNGDRRFPSCVCANKKKGGVRKFRRLRLYLFFWWEMTGSGSSSFTHTQTWYCRYQTSSQLNLRVFHHHQEGGEGGGRSNCFSHAHRFLFFFFFAKTLLESNLQKRALGSVTRLKTGRHVLLSGWCGMEWLNCSLSLSIPEQASSIKGTCCEFANKNIWCISFAF